MAIPIVGGAVRRPLTPLERDVLIRAWKSEKAKAVALPALGLVFAVVFTVYSDIIMIGLLIPAFLAPAIAHAVAKHRRAIATGQAIEFQGVPVFVGTESAGKQTLYRLQFGAETVSVPPSVYGRLVPNQRNTLTVLEGVNAVVAVNGSPPSLSTERVRLASPARSSAGVR